MNIYRMHYRCLDGSCGWQGFANDLGERVNRETWKFTKPVVEYEMACPRCFSDVVEGAWCPTCGERPMCDDLDECQPCFEKREERQQKHVEAVQAAVREYHTYAKDKTNQRSRDRLRALLGIKEAG